MSPRRGLNKIASSGASNSSTKGKNVTEMPICGIDRLNQGLVGMNLDDGQPGDDGWEVVSKNSKSKGGNNSGKQWHQQNSTVKAWGNPDTAQRLGIRGGTGSGRGGDTWTSRSTESKRPNGRGNGKGIDVDEDDDDDDDEFLYDSDDDLFSDSYDSDGDQKSHEMVKKNRWFKKFFESLDALTLEQITAHEREWHCPACKGGPGAVDWFQGLEAVLIHAKTKKSQRVKLHRELATVLDEELRKRGTAIVFGSEIFDSWIAPRGMDKEIVWPPMVIIRNTHLVKELNDKWIGMGNQELLNYFSDFEASKAKHSYGPQGHRGMSVLIFEATPIGYLEADRLNNNFEANGRGRVAWERSGVAAFGPGGKRQLFGYLAEQKDIEMFNQHSHGNTRLKYEMKWFEETVAKQIRQMGEDNQQLMRFKQKVAEAQKHAKALEETNDIVTAKYRRTLEENRIVRERAKMHNEQNKEEMDYLEGFFKEQLSNIHERRKNQEEDFEKIQQNERQKVIQIHELRAEDAKIFIDCQDKDLEAFVAARDSLMKAHQDKVKNMKKKHWKEELDLELEYEVNFAELLKQYTPPGHAQPV